MSRSPRDVQRVKAQGQGKGAILFAPPGNYFTKLMISFVTFLPTPFSSETESRFWNSISYCTKRIYPTIRRWRAKCYFHSDGSWGMP